MLNNNVNVVIDRLGTHFLESKPKIYGFGDEKLALLGVSLLFDFGKPLALFRVSLLIASGH